MSSREGSGSGRGGEGESDAARRRTHRRPRAVGRPVVGQYRAGEPHPPRLAWWGPEKLREDGTPSVSCLIRLDSSTAECSSVPRYRGTTRAAGRPIQRDLSTAGCSSVPRSRRLLLSFHPRLPWVAGSADA
uniref:Uncharacterized protein n=1 Tax=Arundo donax TaxID=35708 RepID=A0A0A9U5A6_ARUDO